MNSLEWLKSPGAVDGLTMLQELSELVGMNGGMGWNGFGTFREAGPYGRLGLTLEEAIRLVYLSGVLDGLFRAEEGVHKTEVITALKDEIRAANEGKTPKIVGAHGETLTGATNQER